MSRTWVTADPHFGHANICKFTNYDGSKMRPWDDVTEMDEALIANWNEVVNPEDRVYLLGDVTFTSKNMLEYIPRLKGRICLVPGNHDPTKIRKYVHVFDDVRGYVQRKGWIMSHIPIHPASLSRWKVNIHGHLHNNVVMLGDKPDSRYECVSVEHNNYYPILLDDVLEKHGLKEQPR